MNPPSFFSFCRMAALPMERAMWAPWSQMFTGPSPTAASSCTRPMKRAPKERWEVEKISRQKVKNQHKNQQTTWQKAAEEEWEPCREAWEDAVANTAGWWDQSELMPAHSSGPPASCCKAGHQTDHIDADSGDGRRIDRKSSEREPSHQTKVFSAALRGWNLPR